MLGPNSLIVVYMDPLGGASGLGFGVKGLGFRVWGLGLRVQGLGTLQP